MAVLRCIGAFAVGTRVLTGGDLVDSNDPAVKGHEMWFEPVEATAERTNAQVEAMTAAPGEKRARAKKG